MLGGKNLGQVAAREKSTWVLRKIRELGSKKPKKRWHISPDKHIMPKNKPKRKKEKQDTNKDPLKKAKSLVSYHRRPAKSRRETKR